jgi:hypothetical protein
VLYLVRLVHSYKVIQVNRYNQRYYLQYRLKKSYEDRILENTGGWIHTNDLVRRVKGDKTGIIETIHGLINDKSIDSKKEGNKVLYKRNDLSTDYSFRRLMDVHQWNYDQVLNALEKVPNLSTKKGKLSSKAKSLLKHLEYLLDTSMILIGRINYQSTLGIISKQVAQQRIMMENKVTSQVMKKINTKYEKEQKLIQEFFQDHSKELRFRI